MKTKIKNLLPHSFKRRLKESLFLNKIYNFYSNEFFSQEGEDIFIINFFPENHKGFYLDIGAHHPFLYSNTALLYKKGWKGINIDAFPGSMKPFEKFRKKDINLEFGISSVNETLDFYIFKETLLNTFDKQTYESQLLKGKIFDYKLEVKCFTFNSIIEKYNFNNIDVITIDIEGHELGIIKSINFELIQPKLFIIEFIEASILEVLNSEINKILNDNGFIFIASLGNSQLFSKDGLKHLR